MSFGKNGSSFPKGATQKYSLRATSLYNVWIMIEPSWFAIEGLTIDPTSYYNVHCELCTMKNILHSRLKHWWWIKSDPNGTTQQIGNTPSHEIVQVQWKEWTSMSRALGSLTHSQGMMLETMFFMFSWKAFFFYNNYVTIWQNQQVTMLPIDNTHWVIRV